LAERGVFVSPQSLVMIKKLQGGAGRIESSPFRQKKSIRR